MENKFAKQKGTVLIYTILVIGIMIAIIIALTTIFSIKLFLAKEFPNSITALYVAESGIEWRLYYDRIGTANMPVFSNGATFNIYIDENKIKSIGAFNGVKRAFEISF